MAAVALLGQPIADRIYSDLKHDVERLMEHGRHVHIRGVLVGSDPASIAYLNIKERTCQKYGLEFSLVSFPENVTQDALVAALGSYNQDQSITGVIVQLPLPNHLDRDVVLQTVVPHKDIDAFFYTLQTVLTNPPEIRPPTPVGMLQLLDEAHIDLKNKQIVVIGNGLLVGRPLLLMLKERGLNPRLVENSYAAPASALIKQADVLFTGVGSPGLITPEMLKPGVVIVDAGYAKIDGKVYGDVDEKCSEIASFITPAVGGVGPLTVAILLRNAVMVVKQD